MLSSGNKRSDGAKEVIKDGEVFVLQTRLVADQRQVVVEKRHEETHEKDDGDDKIEKQIESGGKPVSGDEALEADLAEEPLHQRREAGADGRIVGHIVEEEVCAATESDEKDEEGEGKAEELPAGLRQGSAEDGDAAVVSKHVKHLQLGDECDDSDTDEVQIVVLDDRAEAHQLTCNISHQKLSTCAVDFFFISMLALSFWVMAMLNHFGVFVSIL